MDGLTDLMNRTQDFLQLEKLPELTVLLIGVLVGLVGKNLYALVKTILGVAGSFAGRMASGLWMDLRRETPNVLDCGLAVVTLVEGRPILLMDALLGPRKLADIYLNPRTAFGVRIQTFFVKKDRPWVSFPPKKRERGLLIWIHNWRSARRVQLGLPPLPPLNTTLMKYRRVYQPIENLIGQHLANEWAMQMALGEDCYVFRFVVAVIYEKNADDYIDRQFHALVVWEEALRRIGGEDPVAYQPEMRHRADTLRRIAARYREAQSEFGSVHIMIPRSLLQGDYAVDWVPNHAGIMVPVHRPVSFDAGSAADVNLIQRLGPRSA
ncbi:hypothetical protein [Prosthecomicrobium sp. N25]|uniref:hypothetical protein n=1 Tax=Prosthecomicrobium sp. N25 TaxID=3129254 RepID=UPI00307694F3